MALYGACVAFCDGLGYEDVVCTWVWPDLADIEFLDADFVEFQGGIVEVQEVLGGVAFSLFVPEGAMGGFAYVQFFAGNIGEYFHAFWVWVFEVGFSFIDDSRPQYPVREVGDGIVVRDDRFFFQSRISASWRCVQ